MSRLKQSRSRQRALERAMFGPSPRTARRQRKLVATIPVTASFTPGDCPMCGNSCDLAAGSWRCPHCGVTYKAGHKVGAK